MPGTLRKTIRKIRINAEMFPYLRIPESYRERFQSIEKYCMFVGYPRSGHSLVGSLLDSHPHICIAHEQDVLKYLEFNIKRDQIFHMLMRNSSRFTKKGRKWTGYSYKVEGQHQGQCDNIRVIGDKRGGNSTRRLRRNPELLNRLKEIVDLPLRILHVYRNPFDNIATVAYRFCDSDASKVTPQVLRDKAEWYFGMVNAVETTRSHLEAGEFLDIRAEDLTEDPERELRAMCEFLDVDVFEDHLQACSELVYTRPSRSRDRVEWNKDLKNYVQTEMGRFKHLEGYTFDS